MSALPWLVVFLRHLVVAVALFFVAGEREWREHCTTTRKHWEARP